MYLFNNNRKKISRKGPRVSSGLAYRRPTTSTQAQRGCHCCHKYHFFCCCCIVATLYKQKEDSSFIHFNWWQEKALLFAHSHQVNEQTFEQEDRKIEWWVPHTIKLLSSFFWVISSRSSDTPFFFFFLSPSPHHIHPSSSSSSHNRLHKKNTTPK